MPGGPRRLPHFLVGSTPANWRRLRRRYRIDPSRRGRARAIAAACRLGAPLRLYERARHARGIASATLDPAPVFLIGHWQSGHSLIHYLMACDPQLGTLSLLHCLFPSSFLAAGPLWRALLRRRVPRTRGVDTLPLGLDAPQGDDFAMANLSDLSFYHAYVFPQQAAQVFSRGVLFEGVSPGELREWRDAYLALLRKVALAAGRSRLLLRNASNTARIPELLELFPAARFVHVVRDPYRVYAALERRWGSLLSAWSLQPYDLPAMREHSLDFYERLMRRYLADRQRIPDGQLVEVRHEDLEAEPLGALEGAYDRLGLPGFDRARPIFEAQLRERKGGVGRGGALPPETAARVRERWAFAFDAWGYGDP